MFKFVDLKDLKRRANYEKIYSKPEHGGKLTPTGHYWYKVNCTCHLHNDSSPGSLHINSKTGNFHCFSCGSKGNLINFLMSKHNITYKEALEMFEREVYYG